jgi:hypothetical protein
LPTQLLEVLAKRPVLFGAPLPLLFSCPSAAVRLLSCFTTRLARPALGFAVRQFRPAVVAHAGTEIRLGERVPWSQRARHACEQSHGYDVDLHVHTSFRFVSW